MGFPGRIAAILLAGVLFARAGGCVAPGAGGGAGAFGGFEYINGEALYAVYATVDKTVKATAAVIKTRGWTITEQKKDATTGWFRCLTQDKTQVDIDIRIRSNDFTRVGVRYGAFGDEFESKRFIEQVKAKL